MKEESKKEIKVVNNDEVCQKNRSMIYTRKRAWGHLKKEFGVIDYSILDEKIKKLNTEPKNKPCVLEVGCGHGNAVEELAIECKNIKFYGMDIVERPYRRGKVPVKFEYKKGDVQKLEYNTNSFDVVYASVVMPYVYDKVKALSEIHRVLKPYGVAVVTCDPNYFGPMAEKLFPNEGSDITWNENKQNLIIEKKGRGLPCLDFIFIPPNSKLINNNIDKGKYYNWPKVGDVMWQNWNHGNNKKENPYKASIGSLYAEKDKFKSKDFNVNSYVKDFWSYEKYPKDRKKTIQKIKSEQDLVNFRKKMLQEKTQETKDVSMGCNCIIM